MKRTDKHFILDITESIEIILEYLQDVPLYEFLGSISKKDCVTRRYEIIGEAASNVSEKVKQLHPKVEWRLMKDMRNLLIHEYFGVDYTTLYETAFNALPNQLKYLKEIDLTKI